jgi:hypothetical protein
MLKLSSLNFLGGMHALMRRLLQRLFGLYPGEEGRALYFAGLALLWSFATCVGMRLSEALMLLNVGSQGLPAAYIFTSCTLLIASLFIIRLVHRYNAATIYVSATVFGSIMYITGYVLFIFQIYPDASWFWIGLKSLFYLQDMLMCTLFWSFIDEYHDLQDAKRKYCLFATSIFSGLVLAGSVIGLNLFSVTGLILCSLLGLSLSGTMVFIGSKRMKKVEHYDLDEEEEKAKAFHLGGFLKEVFRSPFTLLLLPSYLLLQILMMLTDFHVMSGFEDHFVTEGSAAEGAGSALALFMGECTAWVAVGNLIFGLFIFSRIVKRIGVASAALICPFGYSVIFTGWGWSPDALIYPILGFIMVEGLVYSIDDNTYNLLLNAVPSTLKRKIRVVIELFAEPMGQLAAGLMLWHPWGAEKTTGLLIALVALLISIALRATYHTGLFRNLIAHRNYTKNIEEEEEEELTQYESELSSKDMTEWTIAIQDVYLPYKSRFLAAKLLSEKDRALLEKLVKDFVYNEIQKGYEYFVHLHHFDDPNTVSILRRGQQAPAEFVIQLLALMQKIDGSVILSSLRSKSEVAHAHAIEMVEKLCDDDLFHHIQPLLDSDIPKEVGLSTRMAQAVQVVDLDEFHDDLYHSRFYHDQKIAAELSNHLTVIMTIEESSNDRASDTIKAQAG